MSITPVGSIVTTETEKLKAYKPLDFKALDTKSGTEAGDAIRIALRDAKPEDKAAIKADTAKYLLTSQTPPFTILKRLTQGDATEIFQSVAEENPSKAAAIMNTPSKPEDTKIDNDLKKSMLDGLKPDKKSAVERKMADSKLPDLNPVTTDDKKFDENGNNMIDEKELNKMSPEDVAKMFEESVTDISDEQVAQYLMKQKPDRALAILRGIKESNATTVFNKIAQNDTNFAAAILIKKEQGPVKEWDHHDAPVDPNDHTIRGTVKPGSATPPACPIPDPTPSPTPVPVTPIPGTPDTKQAEDTWLKGVTGNNKGIIEQNLKDYKEYKSLETRSLTLIHPNPDAIRRDELAGKLKGILPLVAAERFPVFDGPRPIIAPVAPGGATGVTGGTTEAPKPPSVTSKEPATTEAAPKKRSWIAKLWGGFWGGITAPFKTIIGGAKAGYTGASNQPAAPAPTPAKTTAPVRPKVPTDTTDEIPQSQTPRADTAKEQLAEASVRPSVPRSPSGPSPLAAGKEAPKPLAPLQQPAHKAKPAENTPASTVTSKRPVADQDDISKSAEAVRLQKEILKAAADGKDAIAEAEQAARETQAAIDAMVKRPPTV